MSEQQFHASETPQASPTVMNSQERRPVFNPRVDLVDSPEAITLWADLPGVDENTLDITVEKNTLTLKANVQPPVFEGMEPLQREYAVGDYQRSFTISDEIHREGIEATVTQGLLKLTLPKTRHATMRKVAVKAGYGSSEKFCNTTAKVDAAHEAWTLCHALQFSSR
jgi:HSP20 family protein